MDLTLQSTFDYPHYRLLIDELFEKGMSTTGTDDPEKLKPVKINIARMNRIDKTYQPSDSVKAIVRRLQPMRWLVISEGWCGDSAQLVPVFAKLAALNPSVKMEIILRDQHPDVMDKHLTDGKRSIPKFVFKRISDGAILAEWGARPKPLQDLVVKWLAEPGLGKEAREERIHSWYAQDKALSVEHELIRLFEGIIT